MRLHYLHDSLQWRVRMFCEERKHSPTVAVDLDGTLTVDGKFQGPDIIGEPRDGAREAMQELKDAGFRIIIFTVRGNSKRIKEWLDEHDIVYDYINENPDQPADSSGKIIADVYIDDRAVRADKPWPELVEKVKKLLKAK